MKVSVILILLLSFSVSRAQTSSIEDLPASVEAEDVDSLTLEAPADLASDQDGAEASMSSEEEADPSANSNTQSENDSNSVQQETTEQNASETQDQEESLPAKETVNFGDVVGQQKYAITCVLNDDTRVIKAIQQSDGSVGIVYTKFGETTTVALAKNDPAYADQVADKIQNNLANGQYPYACTKE